MFKGLVKLDENTKLCILSINLQIEKLCDYLSLILNELYHYNDVSSTTNQFFFNTNRRMLKNFSIKNIILLSDLIKLNHKIIMKRHKYWSAKIPRCYIQIEHEQKALEVHTHEHNELVFVFGGSAIHEVDNESYPLIRGDVFVIHGNHFHGFDETNKLHLKMALYSDNLFKSISKEFHELPGFQTLFVHEPHYRKKHKFKSKLHLNSEQLSIVAKIFKKMKEEQENKRPGYRSFIEHLFLTLIILVCRFYSETSSTKSKSLIRLSSAITFMEQNYNQPIFMTELAKKANLGVSTFRHSFKVLTGLSPKDYLIRLRIEKAAEMMAENSNIKVIDAAMSAGFENSSYFSRKFKEIIGTTPIKFLKKQRDLID